jgi:hypothetical protein
MIISAVIEDNNLVLNSNRSKISYLGNYGKKDDVLYFLNIISHCLKKLDESKSNEQNIKQYIMIIYYLIILIMPFHLGTASIAEIFLYSLWTAYLNKTIKINQNIMLDVEALTLPYDIFYKNCFEKDSEEGNTNYTPYLIEI